MYDDDENGNFEQIILIKKEDDRSKLEGNEGSLYYIIKDSEGELMEGCSDTEIVYYDHESTSELSMDSADGKTIMERQEEDVEEEEEADKEVTKNEIEGEKLQFEMKANPKEKRKYKVVITPSEEDFALKEAQAKTLKKSGDDMQKHPCPLCNKMLTRVEEHIRLMHRNKVYICNKFDCGAQFSTLKNLQSHQLTCYGVEKAYKCPYCCKEFHRKSNYKAHVRRHNSEKEYQCQFCDSAFVDTTGLRRHFLKHHEPEREIFVSNCCGKRFKSKEGLKKHINRRICGIKVLQVVDPSPIEIPM